MITCDVLPRKRGITHENFNRIVNVTHKTIGFSFLKYFFNPKL